MARRKGRNECHFSGIATSGLLQMPTIVVRLSEHLSNGNWLLDRYSTVSENCTTIAETCAFVQDKKHRGTLVQEYELDGRTLREEVLTLRYLRKLKKKTKN
jgi:hypothetical protein